MDHHFGSRILLIYTNQSLKGHVAGNTHDYTRLITVAITQAKNKAIKDQPITIVQPRTPGIIHITPDSYYHKAEITIHQIDQKVITLLDSIPYRLSTKLILCLKKYCANCINLTTQSIIAETTSPKP